MDVERQDDASGAPVRDTRPFHPATLPFIRQRAARLEAEQRLDYTAFVLSVTDRCNIKCDFCCHPYLDSEIAEADALRLVREARALDFDEIGITGGEPFLRRALLVRMAALAREAGMEFGVISNGYWAKTPARAQALLGELVDAGLTRLTISWDPSHGAYVPAATAQNAIDAAIGLGIRACLTGSFREPEARHDDFGFRLADHRLYRNFIEANGLVAPAGKGADLADLPTGGGVDFAVSDGRCPARRLKQLVLYARGGLTQPCCSIYAGYKARGLSMGDWRDTPLADLRMRHRGDPYLTMIGEGGIKRVYAVIAEADPALAARLPDPAASRDVCALCAKLMTGRLGPAVRSAIDGHMQTRLADLLAAID